MSFLSPGTYPQETDYSFYVKAISTSACGMIGVAERGPINTPTLVTSWEQFLRKFGGYITSGYLAYAARGFFDNGGSVLWVNRIAHYTDITDKSTLTAVKATYTIKDRATPSVNTLQVDALTEGKWGEGMSIVIADGTLNSGTEFNLTVKEDGVIVEVFTNLSMSATATNYVEKVINEVSEYITVTNKTSATASPNNRPATGTYTLASANDGLASIADDDYSGDSSQRLGLHAFNAVDALNIICVPGNTVGGVINAGLTYAEGRKDLVFIAETPIGIEPAAALEFRKATGDYAGQHTAFNSTYGALYYPWIKITDPVTAKEKMIPPTGIVAGIFARSDAAAGVWNAPAGYQRGRVFNVKGVEYPTSKGERDTLYPEGINTIAEFTGEGVVVWGQKTLTTTPSALDRLNVRRLMCFMEESVAESTNFTVFEPNNPQTWRAFLRTVNPFLQDLKDKGALYAYQVQCDEETNTPAVTDRNEMVARIFVQPTKTAEFFILNFVLTNTGVSFAEIYQTA